MEKGKQVGSSKSSSTFTNDLFGPKDSSSSSSSGIFRSVFGPASTGLGRDPSHNPSAPHMGWSKTPDDSEYKNIHGSSRNNGVNNKERNPTISQYEAARNKDPCYFSSSIYYGGQQVYSPNNTTNQTNPPHHHVFKRDEGKDDDDSNGNNSNCASRGNWWQGSLYY